MAKASFGLLHIAKHSHNSHLKSGFTIVELLVVIVVIGILASITITSYSGLTQRASASLLQSNLAQIAKLVRTDYATKGIYPADATAVNNGKGIPAGISGISYEYFRATNGFCATGTLNDLTYRVTNESGPSEGDCSNYGLMLSLDAGNSSSYPGSGTNWNDLSGFGYNATLINGPIYSSDGAGSIVFDGSNDYASLPTGIQNQRVSSITVSTWVKMPNGVQQYSDWGAYILHNSVDSSVGSSVYTLGVNTNGTVVFAWSGNYSLMNSTNMYNDGAWHHLVGVWDGSQSYLYVDGTLQKSSAMTTNRSGVVNYAEIGGRASGGGRCFNGQISRVQIYNRPMPSFEITRYFDSQKVRYGL